MNFRNVRTWGVAGVAILAVVVAQQFWHWVVERAEVPPGQFLVRVHLWGQALPPGEVLAPDESYKGIQKDVLPEGRHFLNPLFWSYEIHEMENVDAGHCLVLTRKFGKELSPERLSEMVRRILRSIYAVGIDRWPAGRPAAQDDPGAHHAIALEGARQGIVLLANDGILPLAEILGAIRETGYEGPYDVEIFSDESFPDSLWRQPAAEVALRARESLEALL